MSPASSQIDSRDIGQRLADMPGEFLKALLAFATQYSPPALLVQLGAKVGQEAGKGFQALGALSTTNPDLPMTAPQNANAIQSATEISQKSYDSPYAKGVHSALRKAGEAHATEALAAGVPPTHIEQQTTQMTQPAGAPGPTLPSVGQHVDPRLASALSGSQTQPQAPAGFEFGKMMYAAQPRGLMERIFSGGGFDQSGQYHQGGMLYQGFQGVAKATGGTTSLEDMQAVQKLMGQEPLQAGEREKMGMEYQKAIAVESMKQMAEMAKGGQLSPENLFSGYQKAAAPFITIRDAHGRVEDSAKDPSSAGDLALVYNFMKVLDPGSTVREGEFATAQNAGGIDDRTRAWYNRLLSGKRLSLKQRLDFLDRSRRLFKGAERQQKQITDQFSKLAIRNGIDPRNVIFDVGMASPDLRSQNDLSAALAEARKRGLQP